MPTELENWLVEHEITIVHYENGVISIELNNYSIASGQNIMVSEKLNEIAYHINVKL